MKPFLITLLSFLLIGHLQANPKLLKKYLEVKESYTPVSEGHILPPEEIAPYNLKFRKGVSENAEWFKEYTKDLDKDAVIPYHENLGISEPDYKKYLELWGKRSFKETSKVGIKLEQVEKGKWIIKATGKAFPIQSLTFSDGSDDITSLNGTLTKKKPFTENANSILGEWSGESWELIKKGSISTTLEYFALGKAKDKPYGYMVYRLQEISLSGKRVFDTQLVLKIPVKK